MVLRLYVHIDETQSLFLAFDLYIIQYKYSLFPCPGIESCRAVFRQFNTNIL